MNLQIILKDILDNNTTDIYVFAGIKSALRSGFCEATDIKNATDELKRLTQNGFQECFQHLYSG
jgi:hypothetical protein